MQITCPSCKRKYRLQDDLVRSPYQKMRCSRCGHVFVYGQDEERPESKTSERSEIGASGRPLLSPPGLVEKAGEKKNSKRVMVLLLAGLILVILAACGYYYWVNYLGAENRRLSIQKMEGQETLVRDGRVFLIKGTVMNGSTKPRKYIILKARLFDDKQVSMGERFALAGLQLSSQEIQQMGKPEIEAKITDFRKSNISSFVLPSRKEMPFSIVFADPYYGRPKEFSVEIVEAPRPGKDASGPSSF